LDALKWYENYNFYRRSTFEIKCIKGCCIMDIPRKLGILIYTAVPAIVGGGIVYHFFGSFVQVIIFEALLALAALGLIRN
jgi:hypothetical protein